MSDRGDDLPHLGEVLAEGRDVELAPNDKEDAPQVAGVVFRAPGDPSAGPLPSTDMILVRVALGVVAAAVVAAIAGALTTTAMRQGVDLTGQNLRIEFWGRAAAVGLHPAVLISWTVLVFGTTWGAIRLERLTGRCWAGLALALIGLVPLLTPLDPVPALLEVGFPGLPNDRAHLAAPNISPRWALVIATIALGYWAGRRNDRLLGVAVVVLAVFLVWEIDRARSAQWSEALDRFFDTIRHTGPGGRPRAAFDAAEARASMWMHVRSLADIVLLCAPWWATHVTTRGSARRLLVNPTRDH